MSGGAFPETPKGSPGAIEGAASRLSDAADLLEQSDSSLAQTARGLSGVAWSGQAEGRFTASAGTLSGVCRGAMASNRIYVRGVVAEVRRRTARNVAVLRAARELSHGVKKSSVSPQQFDRLAREAMRVK